jgi:hypothetical protein
VQANVEGVARHFHDHGLALADYLCAAVRWPWLFCLKPATVIRHAEAVAAHFGKHGLTLKDFLHACVRQPTLLGLKPATVIGHTEAVAAHFQKHGLTLPAYLQAACRQPQLFYQAPSTIQENIEQVASHFREHGLTLKDYLRAAVREPSLFCRKPVAVIRHADAVTAHFQKHGLTLAEYLRAGVRQPILFGMKPATVIRRIEEVAVHFEGHGLTLAAYVGAAARNSALFYMTPDRIIANVETVARHFCGDGLTLAQYLRAAVRLPSLITLSPSGVIRNINRVIDLHQKGLVTFPGQAGAPPGRPLRPLFDYLVKRPDAFCLSAANYDLREEYVRVTGDRPAGAGLLTRPRSRIERDLARFREQPAGEYAQLLAWAEQAFGPGWRPSHRHYLVEADEEDRMRVTGKEPPIAAALYTVRNAARKQRHFTVEDGRIVEHAGYKEAFGPLLLEPHPTRGVRRDGKWCPVRRYNLCSSPYDRFRSGGG